MFLKVSTFWYPKLISGAGTQISGLLVHFNVAEICPEDCRSNCVFPDYRSPDYRGSTVMEFCSFFSSASGCRIIVNVLHFLSMNVIFAFYFSWPF